MFCGTLLPIRNRKQASNTPTPPGAAGTINPIDQDKQKTINKKRTLVWFSKLNTLKQMIKPMNLDTTKRASVKNDL